MKVVKDNIGPETNTLNLLATEPAHAPKGAKAGRKALPESAAQFVRELPASWYVALPASELSGKKPLALQLFGLDLVAWRDESGQAVIMERYCSHMGASLALGTLEDGCLKCPFHAWRYNAAGECVEIPQVETIPQTAAQYTFITQEKYGYIWVWLGSSAPLFEMPVFTPDEPAHQQNYMALRYSFDVQTSARRIAENVFDHYHLLALHKLAASSVELAFLDPASQDDPLVPAQLFKDFVVPVEAKAWLGIVAKAQIKRYTGLVGMLAQVMGLNAHHITIRVDGWPSGTVVTTYLNDQEVFRVLNTVTPIAPGRTVQQILFKVKKHPNKWLNPAYFLIFGFQTRLNAAQDVPNWNTMDDDGGGVYVKHDKAVLKFRALYQKYVELNRSEGQSEIHQQ